MSDVKGKVGTIPVAGELIGASTSSIDALHNESKPIMPQSVRNYFASLSDQFGDVSAGVAGLTELSSQASNDTSLTADSNWKLKTVKQLALILLVGKQLETITHVPDECRDLQLKISQSGQKCQEPSNEYANGVDNSGGAALQKAVGLMQELAEQSKATSADILEIKSRYRD